MATSIRSQEYIVPTDLGIHPREITQWVWGGCLYRDVLCGIGCERGKQLDTNSKGRLGQMEALSSFHGMKPFKMRQKCG
jgi:hypothetical protein